MENHNNKKTWHGKHSESLTKGQRIADAVASYMGSWQFIILQSGIVAIWVIVNVIAFAFRWDPYPFILLNLLFSTQAAYAAPVIMMAQNRQSERDRHQALEDYTTNVEAKEEIEELQVAINRIEIKKLDKIITLLEELKQKKN